jgi:MoxR-like ATPase
MTASHTDVEMTPDDTALAIRTMRKEVARVVVGQDDVIEQMATALIAGGHCLLIGVPGLAKTMMAQALADVLQMQFKRVQFTPDLMPSDITGTTVLDQEPDTGKKTFRFIHGPIFTNILLADEINRTPPKTQAALLEAMQEHQVTFGGEKRELPDPFFVLATQNPLEQEGTYPLPEAQLDRFMFSVVVSYPTHREENRIVTNTTQHDQAKLRPVLSVKHILAMRALVRKTVARPELIRYAVNLARASRPADEGSPDFIKQYVDCGAGPRAGQYLILAAKSRAVLQGRSEPEIEDVQAAAGPVLRHRLYTNFTALSENITSDNLIEQLIEAVPRDPATSAIVYAPPTAAESEAPSILDADADPVELIHRMQAVTERVRAELRQKIVGQHEVIDLVLTALLANGHCLLIGVPGLAKTLLVQTLADVLDLKFTRIQFTPDLMPSDITGTDVLEDDDSGQRSFRFIPGPVFTNMLLADEINRTPPKTQAALLEAMQEHSVTAAGNTYPLDPPFFVLATQNPIEQEGTYPLPEAQLDRFMFNIYLDYPSAEDEPVIIDRTTGVEARQPAKVMGAAEIRRVQQIVRQVPISRHVLTYATTLARATRPESSNASNTIRRYVHCGAGPRACQYLVLGAKARAVMHGRANVSINDIKAVAIPVLRHRIFTNFSADAEGITSISLVRRLIEALPEPEPQTDKALDA